MAQIPMTLVIALITIGVAEWPGVSSWSELTPVHHALVHGLYLVAGSMVGLQIAWWKRLSRREAWSQTEDREVIS
ncbi:hypothetical protein [Alicyclobacillus dauci]|uniref:Uncharacterized protein n=1 Tax=Alicyclobacillus dauci TaxID=1475485 RepID=A0ABY6Z5K7_9BACL|nr:hypothetical protein [Alicyclobacillus dauci]WAH37933.1 hypothetical protein NZD86_05425 [Alicyclobacillus dauci]